MYNNFAGEPFTQEEMEEMLSAALDPEKNIIAYKDFVTMMVIDEAHWLSAYNLDRQWRTGENARPLTAAAWPGWGKTTWRHRLSEDYKYAFLKGKVFDLFVLCFS